jgi:hypothetical protein
MNESFCAKILNLHDIVNLDLHHDSITIVPIPYLDFYMLASTVFDRSTLKSNFRACKNKDTCLLHMTLTSFPTSIEASRSSNDKMIS